MASFSMTKRIAAPIETVFALATDVPHAAEHIRGIDRIELLTALPIGVGARWRETRRIMHRESTEELKITAFDPPHGYTVECDSCGSRYLTVFRFEPDGEATKVTLDIRCDAQSLTAKLMSPLTGLMFGPMMRKCIEDDLEDLKQAAEARAPVR